MGEYAFSDFYPLHSSGFATCLGVVIGAVEAFGVVLAHIDPLAGDGKDAFYTASLDHIIESLLSLAKAGKCDICFFKDGYEAVKKFQLTKHVRARFGKRICHVYNGTDTVMDKVQYDEVVAMPSAFYSAYVCLKARGDDWDFAKGKKVLQGSGGNRTAMKLGRVGQLMFRGDDKPLLQER
jgi:hypothetical protein